MFGYGLGCCQIPTRRRSDKTGNYPIICGFGMFGAGGAKRNVNLIRPNRSTVIKPGILPSDDRGAIRLFIQALV
jgi:hypothetical protein